MVGDVGMDQMKRVRMALTQFNLDWYQMDAGAFKMIHDMKLANESTWLYLKWMIRRELLERRI